MSKEVLKNGDILHCGRKSLMSSIIRRVTKSSRISHTALVLILEGQLFIVDSQWDGTRIRTYENWEQKWNYRYIVTRGLPFRHNPSIILKEISEHINKPYGYWALVKHLIYSWTGKWISSKDENKHLICSEFVALIAKMPNSHKATPIKLYNYVMEEGYDVIPHNKEL
jgi:hypothetical protein